MTNTTRRAIKLGTTTLAGLAALTLIPVQAFASDCSAKKTQVTQNSVTQHNMTTATQVLGSYTKKSSTIVDAAVATDMLSTLVAAVKAADLVGTLSGPGPFTVFAPTNAAFDALPDGTVTTLLKPENKAQLTKTLTAHAVSGNLSAHDIMGLAKDNGGTVEVTTLSGDTLTAIVVGSDLYVKDESGGLAMVKKADIMKSNGTVHVVNRVLLPS